MAIRYDPLLIAGLAAQARGRWTGRRVEGLWMDRDRREAWLLFGDDAHEDRAVGFLLHPTRGFIIAASSVPPADPRAGRRISFRKLFVTAVEAPLDERFFVLELAGGLRDVHTDRPPVYRLFVELQTNQWNAVLTRGRDDAIEAVLWPRTAGGRALRPGAVYRRPEGTREWAGRCPDAREWTGLLLDHSQDQRRRVLLQSAAWISSLNVDWVLGDASTCDDPATLAAALERYRRLRAAPSGEAWLLSGGETAQPYPLSLETGSGPFAGLLEAMCIAAGEASVWPRHDESASGATMPADEAEEAALLARALRGRIGELERRRSALGRQVEGESAEYLRELGHLLLSRQSDVPRGADSVSLEGFDGSPVRLELDPRLDAVQNAARYYERARRRDRAARALPGRLEHITDRISRLEAGLASLRAAGPTAELWSLVGGQPESGPGGAKTRGILPYRRYRTSSGLEVRIGRSARGNDDLTFRHSAPEDIWLHARQAAGAHVILRWERRDQNPPHSDLVEAAVLAALHSEARHSGVVAVDWTRRKHVRKPRKAPPGTVVPERVTTLFVEPDPAAASRLAPDD